MITYKGRQIPETFEEIVNPKHTALVVHEMLNDFCGKGGSFDKAGHIIDVSEIVKPVVSLIDAARKNSVKVIYVRFTMHTDYSTFSDPMIQSSYKRIMDPKSPPPSTVIDGTWGWENIDEVKPHEGDLILRKHRPDAFVGTNLDVLLRWNGIRTMIIVGVGAEVGIVPSVLHASNLGYFTLAPKDCLRPTEPAWLDDAIKFIGRTALMNPAPEIIKAWNS